MKPPWWDTRFPVPPPPPQPELIAILHTGREPVNIEHAIADLEDDRVNYCLFINWMNTSLKNVKKYSQDLLRHLPSQ